MANHLDASQTGNVTHEFSALSLRDLLDAREQYHIHLMRQPNVVGTAVGYYRIRNNDSWPGAKKTRKGTRARTLKNSQIRPYSWPAVMVFVDAWADAQEFGHKKKYDPNAIVPKTLYLVDGRRVPVCVIEAPKELQVEPIAPKVRYPLNNIGSGHPVTVTLQGRDHFATVACVVTDGHRAYALTNRHVTGSVGEIISSKLDARDRPVGTAAPLQESRALLSDVYPGWSGRSTFVNLDVGLVDIDVLNDWTTKLADGSLMGSMVDLSSVDFPLSLVGQNVRGWGASSLLMQGEIGALFYRYKSEGGFEYVADFFIGPRSGDTETRFTTLPGDSGTLWLLEPAKEADAVDGNKASETWRPLAIQWGANRLYSALGAKSQAFALATCLSTVCERLNIDVVRDWNIDQPDTWGAVGHFAIANRATGALSPAVKKLAALMKKNALVIGHDDATILSNDFKGLGDAAFVPLADVPDFYWKHGKQGAARPMEGPNHFADMDQKRSKDGVDLLQLCKNVKNIDPAVWQEFYDSVKDLGSGEPITPQHRGLLPFRVWQIFIAMVKFAGPKGDMKKFVCAAGVLAHYVGDACQPLHISYLHDGDPLHGKSHTVHHRKGGTSDVIIPKGVGVHSAYEDGMVNSHRKQILDGLKLTKKVSPSEYVTSGKGAAELVVELMQATFQKIPPANLVSAYVALPDKKNGNDELWKQFGTPTIEVMQAGTHALAVLWESAWMLAKAETNKSSAPVLKPAQAMKICAAANFLPSCSVGQIAKYLK